MLCSACLLEPRHTLVRSIAFRSTSMSSQLTPAALLEWENIHTMMDIFNQRSMQVAAPRHLQKILSLQKSNEITGPTWPDVIMIRICLFYCLLYFLIVSNFYECFIHRKQNPTKIVIGWANSAFVCLLGIPALVWKGKGQISHYVRSGHENISTKRRDGPATYPLIDTTCMRLTIYSIQ